MFTLRTRRNNDDEKKTPWGAPVRRMSFAEAVTLKGTVAKVLNNTAIGKTYIKDLIETVADNTNGTIISTDILDLFTKVFESRGDDPIWGGIWIYKVGRTTHNAASYWDWVGGRGFAEIYMNFSGISYADAQLTEEKQTIARDQALMRYLVDPQTGGMPTIHELMHVALKGRHKGTPYPAGDDEDFANAVANLAGDETPSYKQSTSETAASSYWGERLNQACGYPSHLSHKFTYYKLYKFGLPVPNSSPKNIA